jgi:ATP:corrinoid adenosyltransferase
MENEMKDDETSFKDLLNMQQAQLNVLVSVCGALIAQRLDCKSILEGLDKYNNHIATGQDNKPATYVAGIAAVVQALRSSVEIFLTTRKSSEPYPQSADLATELSTVLCPPSGKLH